MADDAYRRLRTAITEQRLEPGTPLSENDVARALGVSRTPVREALARLELEGFAVRDDGGRLAVLRLTTDQVRDLFELRSLVESYATRLAAERISDAELALLDEAVAEDGEALKASDIAALGTLNQTIHDVILEASRNRVLIDLVADLRHRLVGLTAFAVGEPDDRERFVADHAEIVSLLRAGDGERAAELVCDHLDGARDLLLDSVEQSDTGDETDDLARRLRPAIEPAG